MKVRAFTLVEVLLALAICSIVLVAINAVFATAVRLRDKTTGPGFATYRGPFGPSIVNAAVHPCSISRRIPSSARTAPFELDPRTFTNPNFCMIRPVYSPSKLSLLITRTCRSRHQYIAGIMQLCQNE